MRINEVSQLTNLSIKTIRYYEKEKLLPSIKRNHLGYREYSDIDIEWLIFVRKLRQSGVRIKIIANYTNLFISEKKENDSWFERKKLLRNEYKKIEKRKNELIDCLEMLNKKIEYYDDLAYSEKKLRKREYNYE